ncbi:hypothetical protein, partial [Paraburkholderia aspalathi]|uniref:hypothetical protein n=1 Tax=Paraburkholderia aspalathi TaxID=1324617 RepID=UPI001BAC4371
SEKRLFHRMISKDYESFVQGEYLSSVEALLVQLREKLTEKIAKCAHQGFIFTSRSTLDVAN